MQNRFHFLFLAIYSLAFLIMILFLYTLSQNRIRTEEEAVYAVLLGNMQRTVIIDNTTSGGDAFGWTNVHNNMPAVSWITWRNYLAHNKNRIPYPQTCSLV